MAAPKKPAPKKRAKKAPEPRGLDATDLAPPAHPSAVERLLRAIEDDGGTVLAVYRDPLGAHWQVLAGLPLESVDPTPFQRNLSDAHVRRLSEAIDKLGRYLDPIVAVRNADGRYWTPNGHHRLASMRALGARAIVALVVPEAEVAYRILALNTEKAHNLKERALEVIRMADALSHLDPRPERSFQTEFEEPSLLTLGACYEERPRFAGSAYQPVLRRVEAFLSEPLPEALRIRRERAARVIALDEAVNEVVARLKQRGLDSPYLKVFVVARINPLRFAKSGAAEFDATIDRMLASARGFDTDEVGVEQLAGARGGAPEDD